MCHLWGRGEVHSGFRSGNIKEKDHFEDPGIDGRILKILDGRICIALTSG
jgi:hypothetical protein